MEKEQIGKIVKDQWIKTGWTMYRLWQNSGVKVGPLQTIFDGSKKYTIDSLLAVCKALSIEISFNISAGGLEIKPVKEKPRKKKKIKTMTPRNIQTIGHYSQYRKEIYC